MALDYLDILRLSTNLFQYFGIFKVLCVYNFEVRDRIEL